MKKSYEKVADYAKLHGEEEASEEFDLSISTVKRYIRKDDEEKAPKIFLFDLETSPMVCYTWGIHKQYIQPDRVIKDWSILSWSGKWLMDDKIISNVVTPDQAEQRKDKGVVEDLWNYFDEADIIVAHNCDKFDQKRANTRFFINDLDPPSSYQTIDTLKEARKNFDFSSNSLEYLSMLMNDSEKLDISFDLWKSCVNGDRAALEEMRRYNETDVRILEEVYLELRPWIKSHPNLGLYFDDVENRCPNCGSKDLEENGIYYTAAGQYRSKKCSDCGANCRQRRCSLNIDDRRELKRSCAH